MASQSVAFPESATAAIAIPVQKAEGSTSHDLENRREEIDVGRPLSLRIVSMYAGDAEHDAALVTSAVRNPSLGDAAPRAMHYVFEDIGGKRLLRPQPDQPGSDVVFYSPAVLDDMLSINLRFSFDNFDADKYRHWLDVASKAASLPVFAVSAGFGGPGGAAAGQAALWFAESAVRIAIGVLDRIEDRESDWNASMRLNLARPELDRTRAGWVLFYGDDSHHASSRETDRP